MKLFLLLVSAAVASATEYRATVNLTDPEGKTGVVGNVTFVQTSNGEVTVTGIVTGLAPGQHGFHVHEKADIATNCNGASTHYNPFNKTHGGPKDEVRHVGDLGNILAGADGVAHINITDTIIKLNGDYSIVDRAVVVHADVDDLGRGAYADSKTTGHAGNRVACGKITNYTTQQNGSNHVTSESTTDHHQRRANDSTTESKTVTTPYTTQQNGSNHVTSESTTDHHQGRANDSTTESKTVTTPSGSAPLYISWSLIVLLSAALNLY